ncbi:RFIP1 protein, partial [Rhinopomastus cyanomelas]|nr:RFIP1 protein [Rhinopomastus cyanomelas]
APPAAMAAPQAGWSPTHVQVTVLRARGLRSKAAAGGSDAYAVMAVGKAQFCTSVAERSQGRPEWRQEATFELPPPLRPPPALRLTVLHRALVGLDKFLGRAEVELGALREQGGPRHVRWYKLHSKPGKKEKERGEIEVDIQFMRSNMTASMFDLSMKDKARSPFGKLKDKLKGKRSSGLSDSASAIVPSSAHSSADSEDESVEKEKKKSKLKALFSKPGLHKSSLSQSMSVLPTQQPVTERVRLRPSDFQSQWDDEESEASPTSEKKSSPSPLFKSRKTAALDRQLNQVTSNHSKREGLSLFSGLKSKSDPVSKSSLCINGSHIYMEESTAKDNTPASSPSPHNFRKKQLFASEENLSSRPAKVPEETGRTSPVFSGSPSLETFKSMSLPSYKLLSSEEHLESSIPASVEVIRETKRPDHKKSTLLSLVTGKKEAVKSSDAENIPDRTLEDQENKDPDEKNEREAKRVELPAVSSRESPSEESHHAEDSPANKQLLNPFEEERKPDRTSVPAKTRAVKPRLGLSSAEEAKATLPAPTSDSLPALLSVPHSSSDNNPFISKSGQKALVPDSENQTSSVASLTPPAAEHLTSRNPFTPEWDRGATALGPTDIPRFPASHHLAASVPKEPLSRQVSGNNPFASEWGQSWRGQGPESCDPKASPGLSQLSVPSLPSNCHFNNNNPFVPQPGWESDSPAPKAVVSSPPFSLPSAEHSAELKPSGHGAAGTPSTVALTSDVRAASDPLDTPCDSPALALKQQPESPRLQDKDSLKTSTTGSRRSVPSPEGELEEKQGVYGEEGPAVCAAVLEPQAAPQGREDLFAQVRSAGAPLAAHTLSPGDAAVDRAGSEGPVPPKAAPRRSVMLSKCVLAPQAGEVSSDGHGAKPMPQPPVPNSRSSDARGCLSKSDSLETLPPRVQLRDNSSSRHLRSEDDDDVFECLTSLKSALALTGDCGLRLAGLPVIPEGGSDDELLGDCQENHRVTAAGKNVSEAAEMPLCGEVEEQLESTLAALGGGGGGSASAVCEARKQPVPHARVAVQAVHKQVADLDLAVTSHSREYKSHCEEDGTVSAGTEERAECGFSEPAVSSSSSLSSPSQPYSSSHSLPSDTPSHIAESPRKPTAEGSADKAGHCDKKKLLQAWVSPSEPFPNLRQQSGEPGSPKHRLHPVKPMNTTANQPQSKSLNVISTMNEKLLEMKVKKYDPTDPAYAYAQLTHDELIQLVLKQKDAISRKDLQVRELEDYIDNLLVRVMEETPSILRVSTSGNRKAGKM